MPRSGSRIADLALWPLQVLRWLLSRLSLSLAQRLGSMLGWIWYHVVPIRRRTALGNLALAFPDASRREQSQIAAGTFAHLATTVVELLWLAVPARERLAGVVEVQGLEAYEAVRASGRGTIAVTAHLGNFDLLACAQAAAGVPLHVVTKALSSQRLSALWMEMRRASGVKLIPAKGSVRAIIGALRKGEVVGLVVDQRTREHEGGRLIQFFGHPAWTTVAPHVLAARTGAAILPVMTVRRKDGTHLVRIGNEMELQPTPEKTMTTINERLEEWIRDTPEQWLWLHRRWDS